MLDKTNVYLKKVCEPLIDGARRRRRMSVPYVARLAALGRWRVERAPDAETAEMRRTASRAPHLLTGRLSMTFGRPPQLADPAINGRSQLITLKSQHSSSPALPKHVEKVEYLCSLLRHRVLAATLDVARITLDPDTHR